MKILTNQTRYMCEHCKKEYKIEKWCVKHETKCKKNPINYQPCLNGCKYLEKKLLTRYFDLYDGEHSSRVDIFWCNKHNKGVFPYWINGHDGADFSPEISNDIMPNECNDFNNKFAEAIHE